MEWILQADINGKLVFPSIEICSFLSVDDPVPRGLCSGIMYKFSGVAGCSVCYVGETTQHFSTHGCEHLTTDENSHIIKHLQDSEHYHASSSSNGY